MCYNTVEVININIKIVKKAFTTKTPNRLKVHANEDSISEDILIYDSFQEYLNKDNSDMN